MRNVSVKFALLEARITGEEAVCTADYLDLSPQDALEKLKSLLSEDEKGMLTFGFSDQAILDILDEEFAVNPERSGTLIFRKPFLDAQSIRLAGGGRYCGHINEFTPQEQVLIDALAGWLMEATRELYRADLSDARWHDIRAEYAENVRVYARKSVPNYTPGDAEVLLRALFASVKTMRAFCHSLTVDALFKADAARVLFGEQSAYFQAWFRKQIFRHMMSQAVERFMTNCKV